ncbi:hypothetical protein FQZ97_947680 [compost metagenome]
MYLGYILGNGHQLGHGPEGPAVKVHVEPGNDDPFAAVGQLIDHLHQGLVKKLGLINAHHVTVAAVKQDLPGHIHRRRPDGVLVV